MPEYNFRNSRKKITKNRNERGFPVTKNEKDNTGKTGLPQPNPSGLHRENNLRFSINIVFPPPFPLKKMPQGNPLSCI